MFLLRCLLATAAAAAGAIFANLLSADEHVFHHENVLGTSLEVRVVCSDAIVAATAEQTILAEIDRLSDVYSSYAPDSELRRWIAAAGQPMALSADLIAVLEACERWRQLSDGAFNPGVEQLTEVWKSAESTQQSPSSETLAPIVASLNAPLWTLDRASRSAVLRPGTTLTLNAIAKGTILDRACAGAMATAGVSGVCINIGGDLCTAGALSRPVAITDPQHDSETGRPLATVYISNCGLATSGNYRRGFDIAGRHYSHILDPRTGRPVDQIISATVVAPTAETADALATTFSVLSPAESARLARTLGGVEYLLIESDGARHQSAGWDRLTDPESVTFAEPVALVDETSKSAESSESQPLELVVHFELAVHKTRYRRPYVAIWLEDQDEFPVRTALLWVQTEQPGPRWHRDLLRWYRNDRVRKLADKTDLEETVSSATRGAGKYSAVFDGKDDAGNVLPPGEYTLYLEVAREHGTYQLIRQSVKLGAAPIPKTELKGNVEVAGGSFEYRVPQPAAERE